MRLYNDILPSGVPFCVRNFTGEDHDILTNRRNMRDGNTFEKFCAAITISVGTKKNINESFVNNMLASDRKYILFTARQFTQKWPEEFNFEYEWPLVDKIREVTEHLVEINDDNFPVYPYKWVRDVMDVIDTGINTGNNSELDKLEDELGVDLNYDHRFPKMYEDYETMLEANPVRQLFTLPESGEVVEWGLMTGNTEKKLDMIPKNKITVNTDFLIRDCKYVREFKEQISGQTHAKINWDYKKADSYDLDAFRDHIRTYEGDPQTALVITNKLGERERVDLLQQTEFFFPSQARSAKFNTSLRTRGRK